MRNVGLMLFAIAVISQPLFAVEMQKVWQLSPGIDATRYSGMSISPDGKYILVISGNRVWLFSKEGAYTWHEAQLDFSSGAMASNGYAAVISREGYLKLLDNRSNALWRSSISPLSKVLDVASDGLSVSVMVLTDRVLVYDKKGEIKLSYKDFIPAKGAVSANGQQLIISSGSVVRILQKTSTGDLKYRDHTVESEVLDVAISSNGRYAAAGSGDTVYVFDESGILSWKYKIGGKIFDVSIDDDGNVVVGASDLSVYYLDFAGTLKQKVYMSSIAGIAVSNDGVAKTERIGANIEISYWSVPRLAQRYKITVLANSIDSGGAVSFVEFLKNKNYEVAIINASEFGKHKKEKFIVVLGGPDAPEGIGTIVREVLSESEQNAIRENGSAKMYTKSNVWMYGQVVLVVAGSDRSGTKKAHEENVDKVDERAREAQS